MKVINLDGNESFESDYLDISTKETFLQITEGKDEINIVVSRGHRGGEILNRYKLDLKTPARYTIFTGR